MSSSFATDDKTETSRLVFKVLFYKPIINSPFFYIRKYKFLIKAESKRVKPWSFNMNRFGLSWRPPRDKSNKDEKDRAITQLSSMELGELSQMRTYLFLWTAGKDKVDNVLKHDAISLATIILALDNVTENLLKAQKTGFSPLKQISEPYKSR